MRKLHNQVAENRKVLELYPPGSGGRAQALYNLASSLEELFLETKAVVDLDEAIAVHRSALDLCPIGHPHSRPSLFQLAWRLGARHHNQDTLRRPSLFQLAWCLGERHRNQGTLPDLEEAITLGRDALALCPEGHLNRFDSLHFLALCFSERYSKLDSVADLEEAITLGRAALKLRPKNNFDHAATLHNLGLDLRRRFLKFAITADIDEAISLHQSALGLRPEGHSNRSDSLYSLALCFSDRYDKQASVADLEEAIRLGRFALSCSGNSNRTPTLNNLGLYLRCRFLKFAITTDIDEAISLHQAALGLCPEGNPNRSDSLHFLALCFSDRYGKQASIADLDEAITFGRAALKLRPPGHSGRVLTLYNLGWDLWRRFLKLATTADIEEAISLHQSALDLRPEGHPKRFDSLHSLAVCFSDRYDKQASVADLEEAITLGRAALELRPPGHSGLAVTLSNLADYRRHRFLKFGTNADLDEAILLHRSALDIRPEGHPDRLMSLNQVVSCLDLRFEKLEVPVDLDDLIAFNRAISDLHPLGHGGRIKSIDKLLFYLHKRHESLGMASDLDECITLGRIVSGLYKELELSPSGSPDSAIPLHKLVQCLLQRFLESSMQSDLDDAINFEKAASALYLRKHRDRAESLSSLANLYRLRIERKGTLPRRDHPSATTSLTIEQIISVTIVDVLKTFPRHLLDAHSGTLCDRDAQISHFKNSLEYKQLVSSTSALDISSQTARMREVVSTYFQYVTLSHRWGTSEPLLRDVKAQVIYDLDPNLNGVPKLQSFCLAILRHGYIWAWSDTCCIDKESSAELQEAISSMYSWYELSALTMVHLADVSGTCSLISSDWFKRGWTLQELLASRALLFFTEDWSLYGGIPLNHKEDIAILDELKQATGITPEQLSSFIPDVNGARAKLQWASTRRTTRPEDIAYSLFGVFDLHLPVMYGESAESALGRLLAEVISRSGDIEVLDWIGKSSKFHSCFPDNILPYETLPPQLPLLGHAASPNIENSDQSVISVRKMHQALFNLPLAQFVNIRLFLPCIVYHVKTVQTPANTAVTHVHCIRATGLKPIEVTLPEPLEDILKVSYVLIRPWHSKLLDTSVMFNDTSACGWLARMQQPFSALLLKQLQPNQFKRVATSCHILAHPTNSNGVLEGEVSTLTIV